MIDETVLITTPLKVVFAVEIPSLRITRTHKKTIEGVPRMPDFGGKGHRNECIGNHTGGLFQTYGTTTLCIRVWSPHRKTLPIPLRSQGSADLF